MFVQRSAHRSLRLAKARADGPANVVFRGFERPERDGVADDRQQPRGLFRLEPVVRCPLHQLTSELARELELLTEALLEFLEGLAEDVGIAGAGKRKPGIAKLSPSFLCADAAGSSRRASRRRWRTAATKADCAN